MPPLLSIIIPVKNEARNIALCIDAFQGAVREGWAEILVIDNFSTDDTKRIAEAMGVRVIQQGPERSTQRNRGWKEAQGEFVFFVDADMRVPEATLREIRGRIQKSEVRSQKSATGEFSLISDLRPLVSSRCTLCAGGPGRDKLVDQGPKL
jgi:glycosyltransferase involved in cell wall biosynthesis